MASSRPLPQHPLVTVILAVRNEEPYIARALHAVCGQGYAPQLMEILVVDGESDDRTRELVKAIAIGDPRVKLLSNPRRRVAAGLNIGLAEARGDVIVRIDGHCVVPSNYVETCVEMLREGVADCVGGPVRAEGEKPLGRAIAMAMSTPFGVGGAAFRWAQATREVDHLPFGAWRRDVFETIGYFDETLVRNQDDELSDRLRRAGGHIVVNPAIAARYFSRASLRGLWKQYLGYGYWKVRVIRKRGGWPSSFRHLVPAGLVMATVGSVIGAVLTRSWLLPAMVLIPYGAFLFAATVQLAMTRRDPAGLWAPLAIVVMHLAYGIGFLAALVTPTAPAASAVLQESNSARRAGSVVGNVHPRSPQVNGHNSSS